jgi:hypothetical protein
MTDSVTKYGEIEAYLLISDIVGGNIAYDL